MGQLLFTRERFGEQITALLDPFEHIIGVEDEGLMKPKAFVVLRGGVAGDQVALAKELQEFVKARLARHKYPRIIEFVADVPKNDRGKVDRRALAGASRGELPGVPAGKAGAKS